MIPFTPKPHQSIAIEHLLDTPRAALWADVGMGKTGSVLTAFDYLSMVGDAQRMLVLAPKRVAMSTWPREVRKWSNFRDLEVSAVVGTATERKAALRKDANIYTINYENIPWLIELLGKKWPFDVVVSDESTRLKGMRLSGGTKRSGALRRVARATTRWINLTGTPSPNGYLDLWGQTWFLDYGERLGRTFTAYKNRWFQSDYNGFNYELLPFAEDEINEKLRDVCLSLRPQDYFDLREPVTNNVLVELPAKTRQLYRQFERDMYTRLGDGDLEVFNAAALTNKCHQLANGAAYTDKEGTWAPAHDAKLEALASIVEESAGSPILVAYWFKSDLARLKAAFPQARELDENPQTEDDWNAGRIPLLLAHPQSAGHGLNLQDGGHIIVYYSLTWNLELYEQILGRIGPMRQLQSGHDRAVFVHHLVAEGTVDELILSRIETKASVQELLKQAMRRAA